MCPPSFLFPLSSFLFRLSSFNFDFQLVDFAIPNRKRPHLFPNDEIRRLRIKRPLHISWRRNFRPSRVRMINPQMFQPCFSHRAKYSKQLLRRNFKFRRACQSVCRRKNLRNLAFSPGQQPAAFLCRSSLRLPHHPLHKLLPDSHLSRHAPKFSTPHSHPIGILPAPFLLPPFPRPPNLDSLP